MATRPVQSSIDEMVAGASERSPMTDADGKSGALLERVVIDGAPYVLKHVDHRSDWIMRQTGDLAGWPITIWESGVLDLVPSCIDHTFAGAARTGHGGAVLMRDVSRWLVPDGDEPVPAERHAAFLDHLATLHAATWGWTDTVGLLPIGNRYAWFGDIAMACEVAREEPAAVPLIAVQGWQRLRERAPRLAEGLGPLLAGPWPLVDALADTPCAFLHGDWKLANLGTDDGGRTVVVDWSLSGAGPPLAELAHYLALNAARLPATWSREDVIDAYRAALERQGVDTAPWWDRQLALCLLGMMLLLGWEKALGSDDELAWWEARAFDGLAVLASA